jgi:alpha-1,3-rhamnosyl/mannosyltransferase
MRVTVDAIPLLVRSAGVKNYIYYWTRHLREQARETEIRLFPFLGQPRRLDHEGSVAGAFGTFFRLGMLFMLNRIPADISGWLAAETDIFHACKLLNPPRRAKLTATVHDLTCWLMPETHSPANVAADHRIAEHIFKCADALIAASQATRDDAVRILNLQPEKICVIYHGIAESFFHPAKADPAFRTRYRLVKPYLLFVGTIEPRKNVALLLEAYEGLPASLREEFDLVLAGPAGWSQDEMLARLRRPAPGVRYLGYVSEEHLPGLFASATAFVYPSLYEGFGFPVAQAMAAGTAVITSGISSLPEITGDAAWLVDPRSVTELRTAMQDALTSPARRSRLVELGRAKARRFTWVECARKSLHFFEHVAGRC